jgi:hypothetical protein
MTPDPPVDIAALRQSLERLLQTDFHALHDDISRLQDQVRYLEGLSNPLPEDIRQLGDAIRNLGQKSKDLEQHLAGLQENLTNPDQVTDLIRLGLAPALQKEFKKAPVEYGKIVAPVISPAISSQIRNARPEMIAALSPIIGQTISKAIADAMQDLRRRIDANLQQNLNLKQQITRFTARLRGVSEADLILRQALDYKISHVFLIHRETGLLLKQVARDEEKMDPDIFSAILTAIRNFAQDTFQSRENELEEIQYGDSHILLRNGVYAYLAVVVEGVQPSGYTTLMHNTIHDINMQYAEELSGFSGEMDRLHDFRDELAPLLNPSPEDLGAAFQKETLNPNQKKLLGWGVAALLLLIAFSIFACIFAVRLMPVAFPRPTATLPPPTPTATALPTATPAPTATATPLPTATAVPTLTATPGLLTGSMIGNVWVRLNPTLDSQFYPAAILINTPVEIRAQYGRWVKIAWTAEAGVQEGWVPLMWVGLPQPVPAQLITPVE